MPEIIVIGLLHTSNQFPSVFKKSIAYGLENVYEKQAEEYMGTSCWIDWYFHYKNNSRLQIHYYGHKTYNTITEQYSFTICVNISRHLPIYCCILKFNTIVYFL